MGQIATQYPIAPIYPTVNNPYLDEVRDKVLHASPDIEYGTMDDLFACQNMRDPMVQHYAWAIPCQQAIETIAHHSPNGVVEIGAGNGYWASLIVQMVPIICYDKKPYNHYSRYAKKQELDSAAKDVTPKWYNILTGGPEDAANHADWTLFLCWPTYNTSFAFECLDHYQQAGGQKLIYVGEGSWGCTGGGDFHERLEDDWELIEEITIPRWPGLNDQMWIYQRSQAKLLVENNA